MASYYDSIKSMKTAKIGTILPWAGDGGTGFLPSNLPKGYLVCDGSTKNASDYPLLASVLGDTYGGDMTQPNGNHYTFPYVDPNDGSNSANFRLPNLSNRLPLDLEPADLDKAEYQMGQNDPKNVVIDNNGTKFGTLISEYGETYDIKTSWSANADIDFTLNLSGNLYFKYTNFLLSSPDFLESIYVLNRKLGINHTPSHGHPETIPSVQANQKGAMVFQTDDGVEMTGRTSFSNGCPESAGPYNCSFEEAEPHSWRNGSTPMSYYGDATYEHTLPLTLSHFEFTTDTVNAGKNYWSQVPAGADNWRGTDRGAGPRTESYKQTIPARGNTNALIDTEPVSTHAQPAQTGMFPRPMEHTSRCNFYGYTPPNNPAFSTPTRADGLKDSPEDRPAFIVTGITLTEGSNKFTLPDGTDITQQYGDGADAHTQWDRIRPLMYVTTADNGDKYKWLAEGAYIQSIDWIPSTPGTGNTTLAFANETVGAISGGSTYGITNNGADNGTITFYTEGIIAGYNGQTVFYYNCETHLSMSGTVTINPTSGAANTYTIDVTDDGNNTNYVFTGNDRNGSFTSRIGGGFTFNENDIVIFNVNAPTHRFLLKFGSGIGVANQIISYQTTSSNFLGVVGNVSIAASGGGSGSSGGFNTGQNYIWFSEQGQGNASNGGERSIAFAPINATGLTSIEIDAYVGNGVNGGEWPDKNPGTPPAPEWLELRYSLDAYNVGIASATWVSVGQIIPIIDPVSNVPNGVDTYTLSIPAAARQANTSFQLYQPNNTSVDNYGITNLRYVGSGSSIGNYEVTLNINVGIGDVEVPAGWGTVVTGLKFRDGTYPTSLNTGSTAKNPLEQIFSSHNHGSFEIGQTLGTMVGPPSHTAVNADGSALAAQSIENALNIAVDTTQPSLTMTFIIKAF